MAEPARTRDARGARAAYEITLRGAPPASLTARFPAITWHSAPAATILSRRDADPADVDLLIEHLRSVGITPLEVHASSRSHEFRIEGRLSDSTLRYMRWAARLDQERTVMRVAATPTELRMILHELANSGIQIDHLVCHLP
ncbi:MAG TPA: hypothetical protein VFY56_02020 [Propionibacteriaceae bacterium]|nr:hypothetical protein [Propionibacteriaceae bacterium]